MANDDNKEKKNNEVKETENKVDDVIEKPSIEIPNEGSTEKADSDLDTISDDVKLPDFSVGDKIVVNYKIIEGQKSRVQPYEGIVIAIKGKGVSKTFTVRRMAAGSVGVERIFPYKSPNIDSVNLLTKGKVRRAKLYYLRDRVGRAATKVKEA